MKVQSVKTASICSEFLDKTEIIKKICNFSSFAVTTNLAKINFSQIKQFVQHLFVAVFSLLKLIS